MRFNFNLRSVSAGLTTKCLEWTYTVEGEGKHNMDRTTEGLVVKWHQKCLPYSSV